MKKDLTKLFVLTASAIGMITCANGTTIKPLPDAIPIVLKSDYENKVMNDRSFAFDLFKTVISESNGENVFISPLSVNMALSMLWNGTTGNTANELQSTLGNANYTREQINDYSKTLREALLQVDPSTDIRIANSVWADNTTPFKSTFQNTCTQWYDAVVRSTDFNNRETFKQINDWCSEKTNGKIQNIMNDANQDLKFALINAIYFNGKWKYKFDKKNTSKKIFNNYRGEAQQVDMMTQNEDFKYYQNEDWKMISMPYGNQAYCMYLLMPIEDEPLDEKIKSLTATQFEELKSSPHYAEVTITMPKFKQEFKYKLNKTILPKMGIQQVFDAEFAEVDEMCIYPMYVKEVIHNTFIDVSEEGTEAAAVTVVSGDLTTALPNYIVFNVDRPFIYAIAENSTGSILFMGRINSF